MKVVAYGRTSTDRQEISIIDQERKLRAYAEAMDHEIVELITEQESAKTLKKRPGVMRALGMLQDGKAEGLLIVKLDRLSRSVKDFAWLIENVFSEKKGKQLLSVQDSIDTRTASGRMVLYIILVIAQWERETIGERTKAALAIKIEDGELCGEVPYGWSLGPDGRSLVECVEEQQGLALINALRDDGWSLRRIAAELDKQGFKTKSGKPWHYNSVNRIVKRLAS